MAARTSRGAARRRCGTRTTALAIACLIGFLQQETLANFQHFRVLHSVPSSQQNSTAVTPQQMHGVGCEPALFSGHDKAWTNLTIVQYEKEQNSDQCGWDTSCAAQACAPPEDAANAGRYKGRVVMVMRGQCGFQQKWTVLDNLGAVGMIVVNHVPGMFPISMQFGDGDFDNKVAKPNGIGHPACMTFHEQWARFAALGDVHADFSPLLEWRYEDEKIDFKGSDFTSIQVSQLSAPDKQVPVAQATFNPQTLTPTRALAWAAEFDPLCLSKAYYNPSEQCQQCYALENSFNDAERLRGKIAVLKLDSTDICFFMMFQVVAEVQRAGAVGIVWVNYYDRLFTFIPHAVPFNITIPMVAPPLPHPFFSLLSCALEFDHTDGQ